MPGRMSRKDPGERRESKPISVPRIELNWGSDTRMEAVILAGGLGTRISEETHLKPKPMIEIGGKPDPLAPHET